MPAQPDREPQDRIPNYVVRVTGCGPNSRKLKFIGTAVFIRPDLLLTCRHVWMPDSKESSGSFKNLHVSVESVPDPLPAKKIHDDETSDLAILQLKKVPTDIAPPCWSELTQDRGRLSLTGFPNGSPHRFGRAVLVADPFEIVVEGGIPGGVSGGIAQVPADQGGHCVGLVWRQLELLRTGIKPFRVIRKFLASYDLELPECTRRAEPVDEITKNKADLAELLVLSRRCGSHQSREAFVLEIGLDSGNIDYLHGTAPNVFAGLLVNDLVKTGNRTAIMLVCKSLESYLGLSLQQRLRVVCDFILEAINANNIN